MYGLKNYLEVVVRQALKDYLNKNVISCNCELCQADIMALALNRLPARYFVSLRGEFITKLETQSFADQDCIRANVAHAAQQISAKPSHSLD